MSEHEHEVVVIGVGLAGATSAGPDGEGVMSMLTLAVHAAMPVQRLREMICVYPTFRGAVPDSIGRLS